MVKQKSKLYHTDDESIVRIGIMKKLWVNVVPYSKEIAIAALESGAEAVIFPDGESSKVRQLSKIKTVENAF